MSNIFGSTSGGSGGVAWGDITGTLSDQTDLQTALDAKVAGPASAADNEIPRFDLTTGKLIQESGLFIDDVSSSLFNIRPAANSTADANPANGIKITGAAKSAGTGNGGEIRLEGGTSSGGQKGAIRFMGNSTAGTRLCVITQTDNTGFLGYSYPDGAYFRFAFAYFGSGCQVGSATTTEIGVRMGRGSTGGFIDFTRSTANTGVSINTEYSKCLTVNQPAADGGAVYFSFGDIANSANNGRFYFHKTTGADLYWNTDGGGSVGSGSNDPNSVNIKTYLNVRPITEATRDALSPSDGWVIFNDDTNKLQVRAGGVWVDLH